MAATPMTTILALEKISKRFGAVVVASAIDLALDAGEALGIIGPNGAGKTTLFGIATGTVAPDGGRVIFAGADITRLPPERRCRLGMARTFQIPQPFGGMTVFENVVVAAAFGGGRSERDTYGHCVDVLAQCGLAQKANRPAGALTLLDRKRLELARALHGEPVNLAELVHAEDGDDVLQVFVALEDALNLVCHTVVLLTHNLRGECGA